jgi:uncharacterized membrane protein required for colicin V production
VLDSAFIFIVVAFAFRGFWAGDTRELRGLLTMVLALLFASWPNEDLSRDLQGAGFTPQFSSVMAFVISGIIIYPLAHLSLSLLVREFNYFGPIIPLSKRALGLGFGTLKGMVLIILFTNFLLHTPMEAEALQHSKLVEAFDLFDLRHKNFEAPLLSIP